MLVLPLGLFIYTVCGFTQHFGLADTCPKNRFHWIWSSVWSLENSVIIIVQEGVDRNVSFGPAKHVGVEISSGKCPCELCSTNGLAMEKELYIESVGDAGSSGASKSWICVLKPPATNEWLTPTDPVQHLRKTRRRSCKQRYRGFIAPFVSQPNPPPPAHRGRFLRAI